MIKNKVCERSNRESKGVGKRVLCRERGVLTVGVTERSSKVN